MAEVFRCGHPRTGVNAAPNGGSNVTCRTCKNARRQAAYAVDLDVSRAVNVERQRRYRGGLKGHANSRKDVCPQGHAYDTANTYLYNGTRQCKQCRRLRTSESYVRHRDRRLEGLRAYYATNRVQVLAANRRWVAANPERASLISRIKKHRRRAAGTLTAADWQSVLDRYGDCCLSCGAGDVTIDHVVPVSRGGSNTVDNVQPLCG